MSAGLNDNEFLKTGLIAGGFTLAVLVLFVGVYWLVRGFPPASRMVLQESPTTVAVDPGKAHLLFFFTKWCPYSQEAQPAVKSLEAVVDDYTYGGKVVDIQYINCESDKKTCSKYKVDSYPSYKLQTTSTTYEYLGPPKMEVLREFLVSALGPELRVATSSDSK
jgi:thiol-disulfide isomerase/thioredoxin